MLYPQYRWVFNKLLVCQAHGIPAFPHGVDPSDVGHSLPVHLGNGPSERQPPRQPRR